MEHPPKQGLKPLRSPSCSGELCVLMEHPPKQGLKRQILGFPSFSLLRF